MIRVRRSLPEVRLELAPLVDVIFLLLTFFVFALVLMVRADVFGLTLPSVTTGQRAEGPTITVRIDRDDIIRIDGEPIFTGQVAPAVLARRERTPDAAIVIAVDRETGSGRLLEVLDELAAVGLKDVAILSQPAEQPTAAPE